VRKIYLTRTCIHIPFVYSADPWKQMLPGTKNLNQVGEVK